MGTLYRERVRERIWERIWERVRKRVRKRERVRDWERASLLYFWAYFADLDSQSVGLFVVSVFQDSRRVQVVGVGVTRLMSRDWCLEIVFTRLMKADRFFLCFQI